MRRARKWWLRGALALLLLVMLAGIGVGMILNTEAGARWLVRQIDARTAAEIELGELQGTLWRGLRVSELGYSDAGLQIRVEGLDLEIHWPSVTSGALVFTRLQAQTVTYRKPAPAEPVPLELAMPPLPLQIGVIEGHIGRLSLDEQGVLSELSDLQLEQLYLRGQVVRAGTLSVVAAGHSLTARQLDLRLSGDAPVSLELRWTSKDDLWSGSGTLGGSLAALQLQQSISGPYPATLSGTVRLLGRVDPDFDVNLQWRDWQYNGYAASDGAIRLRGAPQAYSAEYAFNLSTPDPLQARVTGTAIGDLEHLGQVDARLDSKAGLAELHGSVSWLPEFSAEAQVQLSGFDPGFLHGKLAGQLDGQALLNVDASQTVKLSDVSVSGRLNEAGIQASATSLTLGAGAVHCSGCDILVDQNHLLVEGLAGEQELALDIVLKAPSLSAVWPELSGELEARGHLSGTPALPQFRGTLSGRSLGWAAWTAAELDINSRASGSDALDLDLAAAGLAYGDRELGKLDAAVSGTAEQIELTLDWASPELTIHADLGLNRRPESLDGVLRQATVTEPNTGDWVLGAPAEFTIDEQGALLGSHVWENPNGRLSVERMSSLGDETTLVATLADLPLSLANGFLPAGYALGGSVHAAIDVALQSGQWTGTVEWRQSDTVLAITSQDRQINEVRIPVADFNAELAGGGASLRAALAVDPGISGELQLRLEQLSPDSAIEGELTLQGRDWDWVPVVAPQLDRMEGVLAARIGASGALQSPQLSGSLTWRQGSLVVPALNVTVSDVEAEISGAADGSAKVTASASAGGGSVSVSGQLVDLMRAERSLQLQVKGDSAELINWPEYHVWGSPDLQINGSAAGWTVNGQMQIPRAEIAVEETPEQAVTLSPDIRVIDAAEPAPAVTQYSGEVQLLFGKQVHVQAFGLDTRLEGGLTARMVKDRPLRAEGRVTLAEGVFEAHGQRLSIERGTLTFTGPTDNPFVDVRAAREIETLSGTVTAGIHLTGRAQALNSTVYSQPAMSEAEALSYLVLGRPLDSATSGEGSELSGAAIGMGLRRASRITEQIGRSVGLDQLSLGGDGEQASALVAGKQVNSRLYARYAYGVFSRLGTLLLQYRLSERLTLEAGSGENQTIDLLYTVEKK
jgi:translocation and assembly module TamB